MDVRPAWRSSSFPGRGNHNANHVCDFSPDTFNNNNNSNNNRSSSVRSSSSGSSSEETVHKKRGSNHCEICGKRLLKLVTWRNYLTLPCKCRHVCCKQCITGRLQCRQRVMRAVSFDLLWTFPCPGSAQCGQELTVDFSRGRSYSKNLVARDLQATVSDDVTSQDETAGERDKGKEEIGEEEEEDEVEGEEDEEKGEGEEEEREKREKVRESLNSICGEDDDVFMSAHQCLARDLDVSDCSST